MTYNKYMGDVIVNTIDNNGKTHVFIISKKSAVFITITDYTMELSHLYGNISGCTLCI